MRFATKRRTIGAKALLVLAGLLVGLGGAVWPRGAAAQATPAPTLLSADEAESFVQEIYYEGLPEETAARISPEGAERLAEMLADPEASEHHGRILLALGMSGQPAAWDAIRGWADRPRSGAVDRATFRAWQALPYALGHLARRDKRALARLEACLDPETPRWYFRHHRGARLVGMERRSAATSLALTDLPRARRALDRARGRSSDPGFEAHLREVRSLKARRRSGGRR